MKKIFKHLCLCLCLVMIGLMCFNAKPKAMGALTLPYFIDIENYSTPDFIENVDAIDYVFYISSYSVFSDGSFKVNYKQFSNNLVLSIELFNFSLVHNSTSDTPIFTFFNSLDNSRYDNNINNKILAFFLKWDSFIYDEYDNLTHYRYYVDYVFIDFINKTYDNLGTFSFSIPGYPISLEFEDANSIYLQFNNLNTDIEQLITAYNAYFLTKADILNDLFYFIEFNDTETLISDFLPVSFTDTKYTNILKNYIDGYYNKGVVEGIFIGFDLGVASIKNIPGSFLTPIFDFIDNVFNLEVMPNVKIGYFIIIPLVFGVLGVVLYFWRKD